MAGYKLTTPDERCFYYVADTEKNVNFGVVKEQGVIGDTVYADANGHGMQDDGEPGIADVTLALWTTRGSQPAGASVPSRAPRRVCMRHPRPYSSPRQPCRRAPEGIRLE